MVLKVGLVSVTDNSEVGNNVRLDSVLCDNVSPLSS